LLKRNAPPGGLSGGNKSSTRWQLYIRTGNARAHDIREIIEYS
jgi:hypothetical protein